MLRLLQINITANWGSHGRIAEEIGQLAIQNGWESYIAYGRWANPSKSHLIKIGSMWDERWHGVQSRLLDNHGLASKRVTRKLIRTIKMVNPDIIHLHNIHGYYINYPILFDFLSRYNKPVVWTLHDCWTMTGHCSHFMISGCEKWKTGCYNCCELREYPTSFWRDNSKCNYQIKKYWFNLVPDMTLVPVSDWLAGVVKQSFLKDNKLRRIHNGIDLSLFYPLMDEEGQKGRSGRWLVLAVASKWTDRKGFSDLFIIKERLGDDYDLFAVGLTKKQCESLPKGINGIMRTNSISELAALYSAADVFVNPTYEDNFPTTNLEALACGTPVVTYRTGGSPEAIDENTGIVVETGDVNAMVDSVKKICHSENKEETRILCRERAVTYFNKNDRYKEYLDLYQSLLNK